MKITDRTITTLEPAHVPGIGECWEWVGGVDKDGYGVVYVGTRTLKAHRASWEETNGPVPAGLCVLHKCDNRACIRPDHLFLGTHIDNVRDMIEKGRLARGDANGARLHPELLVRFYGESHGSAKLTEEKVREIRSRRAAGETQLALGRAFGVGEGTIGRIVRWETWRHVVDTQTSERPLGVAS